MTTANTIPASSKANRTTAATPVAKPVQQPTTFRHVADSLHLSGAVNAVENAAEATEGAVSTGYNWVKKQLSEVMAFATLSNIRASISEDDKKREKAEDRRNDTANWYARNEAQAQAAKARLMRQPA